jgi:hypothetical protein
MNSKFSSSQLAELKLPGLPKSRTNCSRFVSRVAADNPELVERGAWWWTGGGFARLA